jgi:nicotinamide mononucleotide transporter
MIDPCAWLVAHGSSCAEALGFLSGALCVYLVTRESIWNWPLGIITAGFYIVVFARSGLYSDSGLQVVYLVLSAYGWWHWLRGGPANSGVVVSRVPAREMGLLALCGVGLWLLLWSVTSRIPGAKLPLLDAALTSTSLVAQYLMTRKYVENWILWITVDVVYIGLFFIRDLRLTALLYAVYLALAILGYIQWNRTLARRSAALS